VTGRLAKGTWGSGRDGGLDEPAAPEELDLTDRRLGLALELAVEIQDFPRHLATHVGGFVMSRGLLTEMTVVGNAAMAGTTRPNVFMSPWIWSESSVVIPTNLFRAATSVRANMRTRAGSPIPTRLEPLYSVL
jgi:hypothetical protein